MGFKGLLTDFNHSLSHNFMYSQSKLTSNLHDTIKSFTLSSKFKNITGRVKSNELGFDEKKITVVNTARSKKLTQFYNTKEICPELKQIIVNHRSQIEGYLGKGFLFEEPLYFRNHHYPEEMEGYDIYSNVWHQDSHDGNRLLKIFVNLMDITEEDGPFHYLNESDTQFLWKKMGRRWSFSNIGNIFDPAETKKAIGKKGAYLIIDTSRCLHRASNPTKFRDMMQITLYPRWKYRDGRNSYDY